MNNLGAYRVYLIYCAATSLFFGMIGTYNVVYQAERVGLNPLQLVLIGTTLEVAAFLGEVPTGIVADVYSRRLSIIIGVFLIGIGFTIEGLFPIFEVIVLCQVLWGIGYTFTSGATSAWITDEVGEANVGPIFMRGSQAGQIGGLIGVTAGMLAASVAVNLPVFLGGAFHIALAVLLIFIMPENGFKPTPREDRTTWGQMGHILREGIKTVRFRPVLLLLIGAVLIYGLYSEGWDRLWQKNLLDNFAMPAIGPFDPVAWFGVINIVGMLLSIAATELARRRIDMNNERLVAQVLIVINGLMVVGMIVFALTGQFALAILALVLVNITRSVTGPLFDTWMNQHIDSHVRATVLSMSSQVNAFGQIVGGPPLGYLGLRTTTRTAIFVSSLILTPVLAIYARTLRWEKVANAEVEAV